MKALRIYLVVVGLALLLSSLASAQTGVAKTVTASALGSTTVQLDGDVPAGSCKTFLAPNYGCGGCTVPTGGTITSFNANTGTLVYKPNAGFIGTDAFTYLVRSTVISSGTCSGAVTDSSAYTINVSVTNATTTVTARLTDLGVNAVAGKVVLVLGQVVDTPGATITPRTRSVTATLDGTGRFTASVYPSVSLSPYSAYNVVYVNTATGRQEVVGVYDIPASTGTVDLATCNCRVIDAANEAKLMLASQASVAALVTQARSFDVKDNGVLLGAAPALDFIAGAGLTSSVTLNSGVMEVTFACASCSGGSLASSTAGRPAHYTSNTVASGFAFSGAHKIWGSNAAANGMEWKTLAAGTGITVTQTPGQYLIEATATPITINSQTGSTQTLAVGFTGATQPAWNSSGNTHTLVLPPASLTNAYGLTTNGAQSYGGRKEYVGGITIKSPGTLLFTDSGGTTKGTFTEYGLTHLAGALGTAAVTGSDNWTFRVANANTASSVGQSMAQFEFSLGASADPVQAFIAHQSLADITSGSNVAHAGMIAGLASYAQNSSTSGATGGLMVAVYGEVLGTSGAITESQTFRSRGRLIGSNVASHEDFTSEPYSDIGVGVLTAHYAFRAKYQSAGTTRYSFYSDQGGAGEAAAPISHGGAFDLRGVTDANSPGTAAADKGRMYYNSTAQRWRVSENTGNYRDVTRNRAARNCTGSVTLDFSTGQSIDCTLTGNVTSITVTNTMDGEEYNLFLRQGAGGTRTVTSLGSNIKVNGGPYSSNSNTTTSNAVDLLKCTSVSGTLNCVYLFDVK